MKILIAEDDGVTRAKMSKILENFGDIAAFETGEDAVNAFLKAFEKSVPFQLAILDVSMPGMTGIDALKKIRAFEKGKDTLEPVKVLMLTSYSDRETVIACYRAGCNDYIVKPSKTAVIMEKIKKLGFDIHGNTENKVEQTMAQMVSDAIEGFKHGKVELPSLPYIVQELQDLMDSPKASALDMAKVIEKDISISIKLISTANSSFYGGVEKIKDVKMAINRLGLDKTRSIVSAIANQRLYETKNPLMHSIMDRIWMHSFATAHLAKIIVKKISAGGDGGEKEFVKGLIHDVGATLLLKNVGDMVTDKTELDENELINAVFEVHSSFGAMLLKKWDFSIDFINVARLHEWARFNENTEKEILIVNLADILSSMTEYGFFNKEVPEISDIHSAQLLGLTQDDLTQIIESAAETISEAADAFSGSN